MIKIWWVGFKLFVALLTQPLLSKIYFSNRVERTSNWWLAVFANWQMSFSCLFLPWVQWMILWHSGIQSEEIENYPRGFERSGWYKITWRQRCRLVPSRRRRTLLKTSSGSSTRSILAQLTPGQRCGVVTETTCTQKDFFAKPILTLPSIPDSRESLWGP